jgi:multiple sugar transport system substrate-binding protein
MLSSSNPTYAQLHDLGTRVAHSRLTRRSFFERAFALGISASAASTILAACGGDSSANGSVTLTLWNALAHPNPALLQLYQDFHTANPHITIQETYYSYPDLYQKIVPAAAGGQLPDILNIDNPNHQTYSSQGILSDLTSQITSWGQGSNYYKGPWSSTLWKGKNYGVPYESNCLALFYNADMLSAAGIKPPTTWTELRSAAKRLTTNGVYGFSMSLIKTEEGTFQFLPFLWQSGADLNSLDSPDAISALQLLVDIMADGSMSKDVLNYTQQDSITQFVGQKAAISMNGPWQLQGLKTDAKFKYAVAPLPTGKQAANVLGGENWTISKTSAHVQEAWTFIQWTQMVDELTKYDIAAGALPSRQDVAQNATWQQDPFLSIFINQFANAKARAYGPNYPKMSAAIQTAFQSALTGQESAASALQKAAATVKPLLP